MDTTPERLDELLKNYAAGNFTESERLELLALLEDDWNRIELGQTIAHVDWDKMYREILTVPTILPEQRKSHLWKKLAIAASILLIFSTGAYFLFSNKQSTQIATTQTQQQRFKNDILPGHQGATLTLGNGQKIFLDSAGNGNLTQQGNAQVIKQGEQIIYQSATNGPSAILYNTMTTERGKQYVLTLADGSKAWLNAASSITYPSEFVGTERKVTVTGEVYFEIAHNKNMPFVVQKNDMRVQVLGTHFNVNAYDDEIMIKTTLLEGSVKVKKGNSSIIITPGQQASVTTNGEIKIAEVNAEKVMAWKNNLFWFDNDDIHTIMREVARWYDAEIVFKDSVGNHYGFVLDRNLPVSKLLKILELTGGVHFTIEGKKITVMK